MKSESVKMNHDEAKQNLSGPERTWTASDLNQF